MLKTISKEGIGKQVVGCFLFSISNLKVRKFQKNEFPENDCSYFLYVIKKEQFSTRRLEIVATRCVLVL